MSEQTSTEVISNESSVDDQGFTDLGSSAPAQETEVVTPVAPVKEETETETPASEEVKEETETEEAVKDETETETESSDKRVDPKDTKPKKGLERRVGKLTRKVTEKDQEIAKLKELLDQQYKQPEPEEGQPENAQQMESRIRESVKQEQTQVTNTDRVNRANANYEQSYGSLTNEQKKSISDNGDLLVDLTTRPETQMALFEHPDAGKLTLAMIEDEDFATRLEAYSDVEAKVYLDMYARELNKPKPVKRKVVKATPKPTPVTSGGGVSGIDPNNLSDDDFEKALGLK